MELMRENGVLGAFTEDALWDSVTATVFNRFNKTDEKAWAHIAVKLREEPAILVTSLMM